MEAVDAKTFTNEMADKTGKFRIAEHGLVGLGYPFQHRHSAFSDTFTSKNKACKHSNLGNHWVFMIVVGAIDHPTNACSDANCEGLFVMCDKQP